MNDAIGRNHANDIVVAVADVYVASGVDGYASRIVEQGVDGETFIAGVPGRANWTAGNERDYTSRDFADLVVHAVGKVNIAIGSDGNLPHAVQLRRERLAAPVIVPLGAVADNRVDVAGGGVNLADPIIPVIGNVHVARGVEGDAGGLFHGRVGGHAAIAGKSYALGFRARESRNDGGSIHHADHAVFDIGKVVIPLAVDDYGVGSIDLGAGGRAGVSVVARRSRAFGRGRQATHCCDIAGADGQQADHVVDLIDDVQVALGIECHAGGAIEQGADRGITVAAVTFVRSRPGAGGVRNRAGEGRNGVDRGRLRLAQSRQQKKRDRSQPDDGCPVPLALVRLVHLNRIMHR